MEQKIKTLLFFKVSMFILLSWIYHFYIFKSTYSKLLVECYNHHRILYRTNYRILAIYNQDKDSCVVCLREQIPNGGNDKKGITNNDKCSTEKKKILNGSLPQSARGRKKDIKNKSYLFETKKYSYLERKIFKDLDYENFLKNNKTISNKVYKKIIRKKLVSLNSPFMLLFLLLLIGFILDLYVNCGLIRGMVKTLTLIVPGWFGHLNNMLKTSNLSWLFQSTEKVQDLIKKLFRTSRSGPWNVQMVDEYTYVPYFFVLVIYIIPLIILGITLILGVFYYHKKVMKYEKIKLRKI
ncbi:fam-l protein [Plasmodium malariae]|uniref:Fam-l protein n=1 Tax=Plasmodium malariae TaxID=5858 RepID=A0A1D3JHT1_PLAMA|nr:fam-l protein [Plasmodium malariae]SBT86000.1 fam-l protein [Plasmodium malariae]